MADIPILSETITAAGGVAAVISGLVAVLGKIWVGRILERERADTDSELQKLTSSLEATNRAFQLELDKGLHVHKIQFEKEFAVYELIWSKLDDVKSAALALRPTLDYVDPKESDEDRKKRRLEKFSSAVAAFGDQVNKSRPFYAQSVYVIIEEIWKLAHKEASEYKNRDPYSDGYWERATKNQDTILAAIDKCCNTIRERIRDVRVAD